MSAERETKMSHPSWEECMKLLDGLPSLALEERAAVIHRLIRNPSPGVRERALRVGTAVLDDETLIDYLRSDADAVLRNAGSEILKDRGHRSFNVAVALLQDGDPDVVLQAVIILDGIKDPRAFEPLRAAINHENINIVQAAITAIGHLGDARAVDDLLPFLEAETWLQAAAVEALGDLRSASAIPALSELLTDLFLGPMAAEAIARIGGARALRVLANHWLRFHEELDPETSLGLLAHVLEGLSRTPRPMEELRATISERLRDPFQGVRLSAARCLLALGAGPEDPEALSIVAADREEPRVLPSCLARRRDLIPDLLTRPGVLRSWGFLMAWRHARSVPIEELAQALKDETPPLALAPVLKALRRIYQPELADAVLAFYLNLPVESRAAMAPILKRYKTPLKTVLEEHEELRPEDRLLIEVEIGGSTEAIRDGILQLPLEGRVEVISQIAEHAVLMRSMPWDEWLESHPTDYGDLAGRVAAESGLSELVPSLRRVLTEHASSGVIQALGTLADQESVPALLGLLQGEQRVLEPVVLESLGSIGGPEARAALRDIAATGEGLQSRLAFRALSVCATEEDDDFFRQSSDHTDWYVRQACAEVLGRFSRPKNRQALARLAADPVPLVAQRAMSLLEG